MLKQHELPIRVRYSETDAMGFLHHANYFNYFEMGRTELLRASGGNYRRMEADGIYIVVVELRCRYRAPARYDDLLTLHTRVKRVTAARLEHAYQLFRDDTLLCEAQSVLACVDHDGNLQRMPEAFQDTES